MLLQVLDYIKQQKVVSDQQMAREFQLDVQALQPMLAIWLRKGKIAPCEQKNACKSSCFKCQASRTPNYYSYQ